MDFSAELDKLEQHVSDAKSAAQSAATESNTGCDRIGPVVGRGLGSGVCSPSVRCGRSRL